VKGALIAVKGRMRRLREQVGGRKGKGKEVQGLRDGEGRGQIEKIEGRMVNGREERTSYTISPANGIACSDGAPSPIGPR
jgi:hypothetical protein